MIEIMTPEIHSRYENSERLLERALKVIPLGTQTFSKSTTHYPAGVSPHFIERGEGSRVWDVDGNEYIDFINSLCAVNLGYGDHDVNSAVKAQIEKGVIFTLASPLEMLVAEKLCEMIPCAERVRFGKNGSDATSGAIRASRAFTGRDYVAVCGYHGWQDWYIGATARNRGVPKTVRELTRTFQYNNIESLLKIFHDLRGQVAAVILEPMNSQEPRNGFLEAVAEVTRKEGALLIFDETITGFRYARGGAQELFHVTPDLATFGKGMANGYPLAAVVGKAEIMKEFEEIFFSFTFGGEALSLAASLATMNKIQQKPVIETMYQRGRQLIEGVSALISKYNIGEWVGISGNPTWSFLGFKDFSGYSSWQIKTLFMQEVLARGVLTMGTHNVSYAHSAKDIERLLEVYDETFSLLREAVVGRKMEQLLRTRVLEPLFKLR